MSVIGPLAPLVRTLPVCQTRRLYLDYPACPCSVLRMFASSSAAAFPKSEAAMNVFDRKAKAMHRDRSALHDDHRVFDYLKEEVGYRVYDRVLDIKRHFDTIVDLGAGKGFVGRNFTKDTCSKLIQCDISRELLARSERPQDSEVELKNFLVDEDDTSTGFPFEDNSVDLAVSSLGLHWVNDLPGCFRNIWRSLKPDGGFLGAMFSGETLFEMRCSLQLAELERQGGFSPHVSPFVQMQDVGGLLNQAGFKMLTVDVDEIVVGYPTLFHLMEDLKGMGENNATWKRPLHLKRDTLMAAASIYQAMYGQPNPNDSAQTSVPATFQIVYFIGWKPDKSQAKPAERGSANVSLKDLDQVLSQDKMDKLASDMLKDFKLSVDDKKDNKPDDK